MCTLDGNLSNLRRRTRGRARARIHCASSVLSVVATIATVSGCEARPAEPGLGYTVFTTVLAAPEDTASVFEPNVAVDPAHPDRVIVGSQYGAGYNRGGLRFWLWSSVDAGRMWDGREVALRALRRPPTMAADLVLTFGVDGEAFLLGLSGDTVRARVPEAALALATSDGGPRVTPRSLVAETLLRSPTRFSGSDKPWLAVDRQPRSPHRGSLYFAWTRVDVDLEADPPTVTRRLVLSASRDGGRTLTAEAQVAVGGLGAQLAVRADGTLDVVWLQVEESADAEPNSRVLHATSRDGGLSFSTPVAIEHATDSIESLDLPTLATGPSGQLVACWLRGPASTALGTRVRCSRFQPPAGWSQPVAVGRVEVGAAFGFPMVAATERAWWLLAYHSTARATNVVLYDSRDGRTFAVRDTLATVPLPVDRFCPRPGLPCRRNLEVFTPGDYVGLSAAADRLVAVYVLPRDGNPTGLAQAWVSIVDLH